MKRLSTFLVFAFLGLGAVKAQSDLLYVAGENDNVVGNAPTLYVGDTDFYVQGGVVIENANTRSTHDGLVQVPGVLHIGNYSGISAGNWSNNTSGPVYTYNNNVIPAVNTYKPGPTITYGNNANTVSLEYGNQLIQGSTSSSNTYFYNLSLLDSTVNRTTAHSYKAMSGADIYVGVTSLALGGLDLNDERLVTQNLTVHIENPSTATSGTTFAISRLDDGAPSGELGNTSPYHITSNSGFVVAGNISGHHGATTNEPAGRLSRVINSTSTYFFPVGADSLVPAGYGSPDQYTLFRPAEITPGSVKPKEFAVALIANDGFDNAGTAMDQAGTPFHNLAGINHQSYFKINQLSGTGDTDQIALYHDFTTNSSASSGINYPNWSTCGNLPDNDFPQTLTIAQFDNNGVNLSWNDVCHGTSSFTDFAGSCGSSPALSVYPNGDFCNNSVTNPPPYLSSTTTVAYQVPGAFTPLAPGVSTQEDYDVAGLYFNVSGGNGSCDGNCAALPLNIVSLTGWNVGDENQIQWVTATEENTDYFIIEKSIDDENFTALVNPGDIPSKGHDGFSSTPNTYNYFDTKPNIGANYYRVREVLYNDQYVMTNVINVPLNKKITIANIYPNPTSGVLNVDFETAITGVVHVEIYDILGRLVMSNDNSVAEGNNTIILNTKTLTAGSYFIRLTDDESNFTATQKFIKITE